MRCVDVIRELAVPTDSRDSVALNEHLSRCSSCANWARQAVQLDRLWNATRPAEPAPEVWDNLWLQVAHSLDSSTAQEVAPLSRSASRNNAASTSVLEHEARPIKHFVTPPIHLRLWRSIGVVSVARAAAVLVAAGLALWFFIPAKQDVATLNPVVLRPTVPNTVVAALPSVDIEAGHMVVILADPNSPSVVDRTPKAIIAGVNREYVDWYGDERSFDWSQVFNEAEYLATPRFAMKE
jgi:hypothetical protein